MCSERQPLLICKHLNHIHLPPLVFTTDYTELHSTVQYQFINTIETLQMIHIGDAYTNVVAFTTTQALIQFMCLFPLHGLPCHLHNALP